MIFAMLLVGWGDKENGCLVSWFPNSVQTSILPSEWYQPILSQLKCDRFMWWGSISMPYLLMNNWASMGCSRVTPIGGVVVVVLVSTNIPFSRRCLLFLQAALPLFLTEIFQSAIICWIKIYEIISRMREFICCSTISFHRAEFWSLLAGMYFWNLS